MNVKRQFGDDAVAIFVMPPSVEELERRLRGRATDSEESVRKRLDKAEYEMTFAPKFDIEVINDSLDRAVEEVAGIIMKGVGKE